MKLRLLIYLAHLLGVKICLARNVTTPRLVIGQDTTGYLEPLLNLPERSTILMMAFPADEGEPRIEVL